MKTAKAILTSMFLASCAGAESGTSMLGTPGPARATVEGRGDYGGDTIVLELYPPTENVPDFSHAQLMLQELDQSQQPDDVLFTFGITEPPPESGMTLELAGTDTPHYLVTHFTGAGYPTPVEYQSYGGSVHLRCAHDQCTGDFEALMNPLSGMLGEPMTLRGTISAKLEIACRRVGGMDPGSEAGGGSSNGSLGWEPDPKFESPFCREVHAKYID